jgi:hypothetical protein
VAERILAGKTLGLVTSVMSSQLVLEEVCGARAQFPASVFQHLFSPSRKGRRFSRITTFPMASVSSASMVSRWVSQLGSGRSRSRRGRARERTLTQDRASVFLQEKEAFTKTPCYHYFHCHCLARYIQHMEQELTTQEQEQERQHVVTKQVDITRPTVSPGPPRLSSPSLQSGGLSSF